MKKFMIFFYSLFLFSYSFSGNKIACKKGVIFDVVRLKKFTYLKKEKFEGKVNLNKLEVKADLTGRLYKIYVSYGDYVSKGVKLAEIYIGEQIEKEVNELRLVISELEKKLNKYKKYKRDKYYYKRIDNMNKKIKKIKEKLNEISAKNKYVPIYSPTDGYVVKIEKKEGMMINYGENILFLAEYNKNEFRVDVGGYIKVFKKGERLNIELTNEHMDNIEAIVVKTDSKENYIIISFPKIYLKRVFLAKKFSFVKTVKVYNNVYKVEKNDVVAENNNYYVYIPMYKKRIFGSYYYAKKVKIEIIDSSENYYIIRPYNIKTIIKSPLKYKCEINNLKIVIKNNKKVESSIKYSKIYYEKLYVYLSGGYIYTLSSNFDFYGNLIGGKMGMDWAINKNYRIGVIGMYTDKTKFIEWIPENNESSLKIFSLFFSLKRILYFKKDYLFAFNLGLGGLSFEDKNIVLSISDKMPMFNLGIEFEKSVKKHFFFLTNVSFMYARKDINKEFLDNPFNFNNIQIFMGIGFKY